jgi:hypothetical protein
MQWPTQDLRKERKGAKEERDYLVYD